MKLQWIYQTQFHDQHFKKFKSRRVYKKIPLKYKRILPNRTEKPLQANYSDMKQMILKDFREKINQTLELRHTLQMSKLLQQNQ